ncbi:MAG: hypothetical protein ACR2L2_15675 [Acidobacteriota bacterium]
MRRSSAILLAVAVLSASSGISQVISRPKTRDISGEVPKVSRHFSYVDYDVIWTLENLQGQHPILNIVTFTDITSPLLPAQIRIYDPDGKRLEVRDLSIETGDPNNPYRTRNLRVLPRSFIGVGITMKEPGFEEASRMEIHWNGRIYELTPLAPLDFNIIAEKINNLNINSPRIQDDFRILKLEPMGKSYPKVR